MAIELRILTGARAGYTESFEKTVIAIGRHPLSDFRFDAQQDLDVSTRHGEIRCVDGRYAVYDSNSTNGTFVNGERVPAGTPHQLRDADVIAFGAQGPTVSVGLRSEGLSAPVLKVPELPPPAAPLAPKFATPAGFTATIRRQSDLPAGKDTSERIRVAVREQTRRLWIALMGIVVVLGGTATTIFIRSSRREAASKAEIVKLLETNETITRSFQDRLRQGDTLIANRMRRVNDSLVQALKQAKSSAQMAEAETALRRNHDLQRQITDMDFSAISAANDPAVVMIASDMGGAGPLEATGFCVRSNGVIVTNRHVVADSTKRASSIQVKFANTGRTYHARIERLPDNPATDLALLQIVDGGKFPTVTRLGSSVDMPVGAPVATIGYPLGTDLPMDGSAAKTTATFGNVSKVVPDLLQIDAFASHGSSGSPVFDGHGHVVGIVWGGPEGGEGRIVFSVPVDRLNELLRGVK
jgi:S1-C subfamily serine protease